MRSLVKPQYVDAIPRKVTGIVGEILSSKNEKGQMDNLVRELELSHLLDRNVADLSGGELQRFAICVVCMQKANVFMFDEPSSYLDVKQRLTAAKVIRSLLDPSVYVIAVEHDLSVLDYLSDFVCVLYGMPGAYGVVTLPFGVREGINIFLEGFVPTENLRFRESSLSFKVTDAVTEVDAGERIGSYRYPAMNKKLGSFSLDIMPGQFHDSQIIVMLGQNGTGKTTFIRMLAGLIKPDSGEDMPELKVSYKPQKIAPKFEGTVRMLLQNKIRAALIHPQFNSDVYKPLDLEGIIDQEVQHLSGGELQRVALALALGQPADVYLIDEPSAYLDSEQRIVVSKIIKRFIMHSKKTGFVVEHDFIMATYLADKVVVYQGNPGVACTANSPQDLLNGMNSFLKQLNITFRRDPTNFRPRINKLDSVKDREQKAGNNYFFLDATD